MKKISVILVLLLFISCTIQYEGDERLFVTGKLVDKYHNPIPYSNVELWVHADGLSSDMISFTETDSNGTFRMLFPKPIGETTIEVAFNDKNSVYRGKRFLNIYKTDFLDYRYDLNLVTLYQTDDISNLNVLLNRVNPDNFIKRIHLIGQIAEENFLVNPIGNYENFYYDGNYFNQVAKNQTIIIEYDVLNRSTNQITTMQQNINIGSDNNIGYTLDY